MGRGLRMLDASFESTFGSPNACLPRFVIVYEWFWGTETYFTFMRPSKYPIVDEEFNSSFSAIPWRVIGFPAAHNVPKIFPLILPALIFSTFQK